MLIPLLMFLSASFYTDISLKYILNRQCFTNSLYHYSASFSSILKLFQYFIFALHQTDIIISGGEQEKSREKGHLPACLSHTFLPSHAVCGNCNTSALKFLKVFLEQQVPGHKSLPEQGRIEDSMTRDHLLSLMSISCLTTRVDTLP